MIVNYIVLGAYIVFEAGSWFVAFREFCHQRGRLGWLEAVRALITPIAGSLFHAVFQTFSRSRLGVPFAIASKHAIFPA